MHLLLLASFKESEWKGRKVVRGQVIIGTNKLGDDLGLSRQQVRTALKKLIKTNEITTEATNKYTVITITNWDRYQEERTSLNQQETDRKPHLNNLNNLNNLKNKETICSVEETTEPVKIFLPTRDKDLFPVTEKMFLELEEVYPEKNVWAELKKMEFWLKTNPKRQKSKGSMMRFIGGWLASGVPCGKEDEKRSGEYDDLERLTRLRAEGELLNADN